MSYRQGAKFSLWGGDIYGKNKEVITQKRLIQEWYSAGWEKPSLVTFKITQEKAGTRLELTHEDVPPR